MEVPVTGGHVKLQWKPDWGMRWAALGVDYEMYGKDLIPSAELSARICKALGQPAPELYNYELFLDADGQKISKSKGNGLSMEEWLTYAAPRVLGLLHVPEAEDGEAAALRRDPESGGRVPPAAPGLSRPGRRRSGWRTRCSTSTARMCRRATWWCRSRCC